MKRTVAALVVSVVALLGAAVSAQADSDTSSDARSMIQLGFDWL